MKYVIMSRNTLEGFQRGAFVTMTNLFMTGYNEYADVGKAISWSEYIADAMLFDSEQEAWNKAFDIWGISFAQMQMLVVSMHHRSFEGSVETKNYIMNKVSNNG